MNTMYIYIAAIVLVAIVLSLLVMLFMSAPETGDENDLGFDLPPTPAPPGANVQQPAQAGGQDVNPVFVFS